jgi:hypothetical protein
VGVNRFLTCSSASSQERNLIGKHSLIFVLRQTACPQNITRS